MSIDYQIKPISATDVLPLRQKVLRPHQTIEDCKWPGDNDPTTLHLGVIHKNKIICVATFLRSSHNEIASGNPYQLRGMATDPAYQSQGFGQLILQHAFSELKNKQAADLLWCNARLKALNFYQRLGFAPKGESFEIQGTGPHQVMYKYLLTK